MSCSVDDCADWICSDVFGVVDVYASADLSDSW